MYRIDNETNQPVLPPPPLGTALPGYFTDGSPNQDPTILDGWWLNQVQEEILAVVEYAGLAPAKNNHRQLLEALQHLGLGVSPGDGFLPLSGGALSGPGNLTVEGFLSVHGESVMASLTVGPSALHPDGQFEIAAVAGNSARMLLNVRQVRSWWLGVNSIGQFQIIDFQAGAPRLTINTAGIVAIENNLTVNGAGVHYLFGGGNAIGFGWDAGRLTAYVDGQPIGGGLTTMADLGGYLPLIGGNLSGPGHLGIFGTLTVAGNFVAGAGGNLDVTNSVNAQNLYAAGIFASSAMTTPHIVATTVNAVNADASGQLSAGNAAITGALTAGSISSATVTATNLIAASALWQGVANPLGNGTSVVALHVGQYPGAPQAAEAVRITGRVYITADGDEGLNLQNASAHFGRAIGVGRPAHQNTGSVDVNDNYYRQGGPILMIDRDMEDQIRAAPDDSMFLIHKISADHVEASRVEAGSAAEADARGRRPLYLVLGEATPLPEEVN